MAELYTLKRPESIKRKKRVGRGTGSGHGKTSCRGQKGQMSRSGAKRRAWFEGGQMPLQRRVPKRGFNNPLKEEYQIVNIVDLNRIEQSEINPKILVESGLIKKENRIVKILGKGDINKALKVCADKFSSSAKEKIEKAGGSVINRKSANKTKSV